MDNFTYRKFQQAKKDKDLVQMENLYKENKSDNIIAFEYAKLLVKNRKHQEAREIFLTLLNTQNRIYARLELGRLEFSQGNIELARKYFKDLLNTPNWTYAKLELGRLEFSQGNIELARKYFQNLLSGKTSARDKQYAKLELGRLEFSQGNIGLTRKYFKDLLNTPNWIYGKLELGRLEFSQGNIGIARNYFQDLLNTPNWTYAKLELGRLEFSQGNISIARNYFQDLLNTPNWTYAKLELGRLEFSQGNISIARNYFQDLLNTPNRSCAKLELGRLEFSQGNISIARNYFQDLLNASNRWYAIVCLISLFIKQNDYLCAFEYITSLKRSKIPLEFKKQVKMLELYIMKELNIFFDKETKIGMNYNNYQVVDYDEFVAIEHIIDGHKEEFSTGIDVYRLFNDIRGKLTDEYKFKNLSVNDIYYMPYENIGDDCHILCVVTLPNSKNILTMFPLNQINYNLEDDSLDFDKGPILQRKKV